VPFRAPGRRRPRGPRHARPAGALLAHRHGRARRRARRRPRRRALGIRSRGKHEPAALRAVKHLPAILVLTSACATSQPAPGPTARALPPPQPPAACAPLSAEERSALERRLFVFVSDLHFGLGKLPDGRWNPIEDFRWPRALNGFLAEISRKSGGQTT